MQNSQTVSPNTASRESLFARIGAVSYRYRWIVVLIWTAFLIFSLLLAPRLDSVLKGLGVVYEQGAAGQAEQLLKQELNLETNALVAIFQSPTGDTLASHRADIEQTLDQIQQLDGVKAIARAIDHPEYHSADKRTEYSTISLRVEDTQAFPVIEQIEQRLKQQSTPKLNAFLTGEPVIDRDGQRLTQEDLQRVELLALPLTLIALLFVFGSVVAAALPVVMGIMAVAITSGILAVLTLEVNISVLALNLTTMLGLGLGIDYSLLIVSRFREELQTDSIEQTVIRTVDAAGRAVFFSGLTVGIGLLSLLCFPVLLLRSLAIAGAIVVFVSVAAALTLVPALLGLVGTGINRWRILPPSSLRAGIWGAIARHTMRHSVAAVAFVMVFILVLSSPFQHARFGLGDYGILPQNVPSRQGVEVLQNAFGIGETVPILLVASSTRPGKPILSSDHIATLFKLVNDLKTDPQIADVYSLFNLDPKLNLAAYQHLYQKPEQLPPPLAKAVKQLSSRSMTLIILKGQTGSNNANSKALIEKLRRLSPVGLRLQVGGAIARQLDTIQVVAQRFPIVLAAMLAVTFVVLCLLLNSVVLPLKAIAMNLLSMGASFGLLVFVFQEGHLHEWLNFTPLGYLDTLIAVTMFCVLFGLSMDYEVFLLCRIKEAYDRTQNNHLSVVEGVERTGGIITSAALLLMLVTGAFALTSIVTVKALGLGIALGVLMDATLIRMLLVPATMRLMGHWNWWTPKFLRGDRIPLKVN
jgi:putative drug exporter of the RND superfamily